MTKAQRDAGAPVSVAETQMHYLPCGAHRGREAAERERTDSFHRDGLARLVYFNPLALPVLHGRLRPGRGGGSAAARPGRHRLLLPRLRGRVGAARLHPGAARPVRLHPPRRGGLLRRAGAGGRVRGGRRLDGGLRRVDPARGRPARRLDRRRRPQPLPDRLPLHASADRGPLRAAARALRALGLDRDRPLRGGGLGRRPDHGLGLRRDQLRRHPAALGRHERSGPLGHRHRRLRLVRGWLRRKAGRDRGREAHARSCSRAGSSSARWYR